MLNPNIRLIFICISLLYACNKEDNLSPYDFRDYSGEVSAIKNGIVWDKALIFGHNHQDSTTIRIVHSGLTFSIDVFNDLAFLRESLNFQQIPCKTGKYSNLVSVHPSYTDLPTVSYLTILDDGDVVGDVYNILETEENYIEIESMTGDEITASFQITFIRDTSRRKTNLETPDTVQFRDGFFHTKLND